MRIPRQKIFFDPGIKKIGPATTIFLSSVALNLLLGIIYANKKIIGRNRYTISTERFADWIRERNPNLIVYKTKNSFFGCGYYLDLTGSTSKNNRDEVREMLNNPDLAKKFKIDIENPKNDLSMMGYALKNRKNLLVVNLTDPPQVMAHEYGHYLFQKTKTGRLVQGRMYNQGIFSDGFIQFLTGLLSFIGIVGVGAEMAIGAILKTPTLVSEFMASYNAVKVMREFGYSEDDIKAAKRTLACAYGTYITHTFANAAVGIIFGKLLRNVTGGLKLFSENNMIIRRKLFSDEDSIIPAAGIGLAAGAGLGALTSKGYDAYRKHRLDSKFEKYTKKDKKKLEEAIETETRKHKNAVKIINRDKSILGSIANNLIGEKPTLTEAEENARFDKKINKLKETVSKKRDAKRKAVESLKGKLKSTGTKGLAIGAGLGLAGGIVGNKLLKLKRVKDNHENS